MIYRLDLHLHTEHSPDSRVTIADAVRIAEKKHIDAIAVCDHNRCAPQEVFDRPLRGGVLLIPSVEYSTEAGHLLGLFLQKPVCVPGEETGRVRFSDAAEAIRAAGGVCVLAHPYELTQRSVEEISARIAANEALLDGIEIFNSRATKKRKNANLLAREAAERFSRPVLMTAGSDAHTLREIGGAYVEVEAAELTAEALRAALQAPASYGCGKCRHTALAQSRLTHLQKNHAGLKSYLNWCAYAGLCLLRAVKGVFQ
ncbi:MAG: PHP domain-containing protein [Oscillospiraceae bacterium]|nr:PHP domain-containing protein [Oscillospiraceae bacterium]